MLPILLMGALFSAATPDQQIAEVMADLRVRADGPLRFVQIAYPWGEPGSLRDHAGPDKWQAEFLIELGELIAARGFNGIDAVDPIRMVRSSGHGIGKSTVSAWVVNYLMSTRPNSQGTVTANTFPQLQTKTWAAIQRWTRMCITGHWFDVTGDRIMAKEAPESWFCSAQTCREENSEAFAGQHAANSTSWYLFDEASAIPDKIWEVAEGGLTDGEPMLFAWGNPTRSSGKFYRVVFGSDQARWNRKAIDSRECAFTNKALIDEWLKDYGEDSDFFRVRVRGLPPRAGELQFIDQERIWQAQRRKVEPLADEPLVAGFDVSGGGSAWNVVRFRRGLDAASIKPIKIPGEFGRDRSVLVARIAEVLREKHQGRRVSMMFVDSAFGAPIVERLKLLGFDNVMEVNFGGASPDRHQANMRAYMWNQTKDWLLRGSIDADTQLEIGLTGPGYHLNRSNQLVLESKQEMQKRGVASPDDADALCLSFAHPVAPETQQSDYNSRVSVPRGPDSWMA